MVKKRFGAALGGGELWALYEFFELAFPHVDCALRRMLWCRDVEIDQVSARAMGLALSLFSERLGGGACSEELYRRVSHFGIVGATRVALEHLRPSTVEASLAVPSGAGVSRAAGRMVIRLRRQAQYAHQVLAALPIVDAELVVLSCVFDMSAEEIGFVLGQNPRRLQRRVAGAKRRFARAIEWKAAS